MTKKAILIFGILFLWILYGFSAELNEPQTKEEKELSSLLDSVNHYVYQDIEKSKMFLNQCDSLVKLYPEISTDLKAKHILFRIYRFSDANMPLEVYNTIAKNKSLVQSSYLYQDFVYMEGFSLMSMGDYEGAQSKFFELIQFVDEKESPGSHVSAYYSLGQLYQLQDNFKEAETFLFKAIALEDKYFKNFEGRSLTYLELANNYFKKKEFRKGLEYSNLGKKIAEKNKDLSILGIYYILEADINRELEKFDAADRLLKISQELTEQSEDIALQKDVFLARAELCMAQNKNHEAIAYYLKGIDLLGTEIPEKVKAFNELNKAYAKVKNFEEAYKYLELSKTLQDSTNNFKKQKAVAIEKIKFHTAQKEKENELLASTLQTKQANEKLYKSLAVFFTFSLIVLYGLFYQKKKYNQKLKKEVNRRTTDLEETNKKLSKTVEELENFNFILSHDLKEPVRNIVSFSSLVKRNISGDEKLKEYFNYIENSGTQLNNLISDVLTFHKAGNNAPLDKKQVNLSKVIDNIKKMLSNNPIESNLVISTQNLNSVFTNEKMLLHVVKNLIENGLKYNDSEHPLVKVYQESEKESDTIFIEDNGIGIAQEYHDQIFKMFKRLNHRGKYSGTGLGLSIARKITEKMDGQIYIANSEFGKGTTMAIKFAKPSATVHQDTFITSLHN